MIRCRRTIAGGWGMARDGKGFRIGFFGDVRREEAGATLFERVVETGSLVLRQVGGNRAGEVAAHRFLSSPHVTPEEILATAAARTASACVGRRIVAAQDTTEINFSGRNCPPRGLGPAGDGTTPGFFCHAMVAIDVDGDTLLGVVHADIWTRPVKQAAARRSRRIEDKESFRWIRASHAACDLLNGAAQLIIVGDRESDIYAQFVRVPQGADLIVRAAQNRKLDNDERLFDAPCDWRKFGVMDVSVPPRRPGEAARIAKVSVKAGRVCIARPGNGADPTDPATVTLTYVEVCETSRRRGIKPSSGDCSRPCPFVGKLMNSQPHKKSCAYTV